MEKRISDGLMRRAARVWCAAAVLAFSAAAAAAPRVATADWAAAETLAAMNLPPAGVGDKRAYGTWVGYPPLPAQTADTGLRFQPNLEQLRRIRPDMFVQSSWFGHLKPQFGRIAPVYEIDFALPEGITYAHAVSATRRLGRLVGADAAAQGLIADTDRQLAQYRARLSAWRGRPLAVVQFADARHVRIYGRTSLYQAVMGRLGLENAWQGESNAWGFALIPLVRLADLPEGTLLVVVGPHPVHVRPTLEKSALWRRLPFARAANRRILPPAWSYGALPSMRHFARLLAETLPSEKEMPW